MPFYISHSQLLRCKALLDIRPSRNDKFTVDLSLNRIHPSLLPQLIALLDQLPGMALDLSIHSFDWSNLKEVLIQEFNPRGFRQGVTLQPTS